MTSNYPLLIQGRLTLLKKLSDTGDDIDHINCFYRPNVQVMEVIVIRAHPCIFYSSICLRNIRILYVSLMGLLKEPVSLCLNIKQHFPHLHTVSLWSKQMKAQYIIRPTNFTVHRWNMREQENQNM